MNAWERFRALSWQAEALGVALDLSDMGFSPGELGALDFAPAFAAMTELERGALANPDEGRMVGHYWLRAPELAPNEQLCAAIVQARTDVVALAARVQSGAVAGTGGSFREAIVAGIGGSALGPQLLCDALGHGEALSLRFLDNTDPDGIDRLLAAVDCGRTLVLVVSKSGGTKETNNGMLELEAAFADRRVDFARAAVAITQADSRLDRHAAERGWLARLPLWDWVGGRTSVTSAVGLLPLALAGGDVEAFLRGARAMDALSRHQAPADNPAALLAGAWYLATGGAARKAMVMLPYKDRLALLGRYLQQLVMESLGKRDDLGGRTVHQGLTVYGNKGSTDQHAYVQQLYDGPDDFFVTFVEVLRDRAGRSIEVEPGVTSGDYLNGFLHGTRRALADRGRCSLTISLQELDAQRLGALIALYERAVGFYATLCGINAYHQPAVESGKRAAGEILALQGRVLAFLSERRGTPQTIEAIAAATKGERVAVWRLLRHLAANERVRRDAAERWSAW